MNSPKITITITLAADGAFSISTDYSPDIGAEEASRLKQVFQEHAVKRVTLELQNLFK